MQKQKYKSEYYEWFHAAPHVSQKGMLLNGSTSGVRAIRPATIVKLESQSRSG